MVRRSYAPGRTTIVHYQPEPRLTDSESVPRYLFSSHDGFGLGHTRRNTLIAREILRRDPTAHVALVTGVAMRPSWLGHDRMSVIAVPPLVKDREGAYRNGSISFEAALQCRSEAFDRAVDEFRPDCVIVDRHPYGIGGELRLGLDRARAGGASIVLGLRDILDEPEPVRSELAGDGWHDVERVFDEVLVYGDREFCDHEAEYGLPMRPKYCGWVVEHAAPTRRNPNLLVVAAGGGGDGDAVFDLGVALIALSTRRTGLLVAGPYATETIDAAADAYGCARDRLRIVRNAPGCVDLFARAGAVLQMAGYNSTLEALAAGIRPILVPRRAPRREQAIRAGRLAALGLADVVDEHAPAAEVAWLLERDRRLAPNALAEAGIALDGATRAARRLETLVPATVR